MTLSSSHKELIIVSAISGLLGLFCNKILDLTLNSLNTIYTQINDYLYLTININIKSNPKCAYAILQELSKEDTTINTLLMNDGNNNPIFKLPSGKYNISSDIGDIVVTINEKTISLVLLRLSSSMKDFKKYMKSLYKKYNNTSQIITFFTSDDDGWRFPIFRQPRLFTYEKLPQHMQLFLSDVNKFMSEEDNYRCSGIPFRKGYLLYGIPGSGKSTSIELIAKEYNMSVYLVNLNSEKMTDTILINLISKIPPHSLLAFEEIDKQLETLAKNSNNKVSIGGLLTAIDGPHRLSYGSIVILTSNTDSFLNPSDKLALLRQGRIDVSFHFDQLL